MISLQIDLAPNGIPLGAKLIFKCSYNPNLYVLTDKYIAKNLLLQLQKHAKS